jgi:2-succinyl-6-hydroxy-2,4-cyclohexadiene-1-carboxylate synthase
VTISPATSYWVNAAPYRFRVLTQGNPRRPWLVFLHGFLGDRFEFAPVMEALTQDFFCVAPDLPGHGETIVMDGGCPALVYRMESTAQGVIHCLRRLHQDLGEGLKPSEGANHGVQNVDLQRIGLVGYSLGGRLGLYLLLNFSEVFRGGVLESASPGLETPAARSARLQQDDDRARILESLDRKGFQDFLQQWYRNPIFKGLPEHPHYPLLLQQRQTGNPQHLAQSLRYLGLGAQPSLWADLTLNRLPLTFVVGAWDHKFVTLNQTMADRCPRSQLKVIPEVSHNTHWGKTTEFIQILQIVYDTRQG